MDTAYVLLQFKSIHTWWQWGDALLTSHCPNQVSYRFARWVAVGLAVGPYRRLLSGRRGEMAAEYTCKRHNRSAVTLQAEGQLSLRGAPTAIVASVRACVADGPASGTAVAAPAGPSYAAGGRDSVNGFRLRSKTVNADDSLSGCVIPGSRPAKQPNGQPNTRSARAHCTPSTTHAHMHTRTHTV